ncbi:19595_t:CDS:2 [Gigaspora rosea]|nr:19595_t:CDS:2 [Gigaspora rosea]
MIYLSCSPVVFQKNSDLQIKDRDHNNSCGSQIKRNIGNKEPTPVTHEIIVTIVVLEDTPSKVKGIICCVTYEKRKQKKEMQKQQRNIYQPNNNFSPNAPYIHYNDEQFPLPNESPIYNENIVSALNIQSRTQFNAQSNYETYPRASNLHRVPTTLNSISIRRASEVKGEFESKLIGSPNNGIAEQMNSAVMFDKQYLLLGNDNGLWIMDFSIHWDLIKPMQIIRGCSFKKLYVIEECNMMISISGKKDMIRIYKLDSLLHLIKFVSNSESKAPIDLSKAPKKFLAPRCENCGRTLDENRTSPNCQHCGFAPSINSKISKSNFSEPLTPSPSKLNRKLTNLTSHLSIYVRNYLSNPSGISAKERATMWGWATDYISLPESVKDCITFDICETRDKLILTVVTLNNGIILFSMPTEMKGNPECRFEYLKSYYVPGTPNFVNVVTDLSSIKQIIAITGIGDRKVAIIDCYTTEVTEVNMKKNITPKNIEFPSWTNFMQIPYSYSLDFLNNNPVIEDRPTIIPLSPPYRHSHFLSTPPPSLSHGFPLEKEKGVDVVSRHSSFQSNEDSVDDKSHHHSNEFLSPPNNTDAFLSPPISPMNATFETLSPGHVFICTISNTSHLVNIHAEPYKHNRPIIWSSDPIQITLLQTYDDILVMAFERQSVEVASLKTGKIIKQVTTGSQIKYLGESLRKPIHSKGTLSQYKNYDQSDDFIRKHGVAPR